MDPAITTAWQVNFALTPATTTASGTITGTVRLTQLGSYLDVIVDRTITQLDPTGQTLAQAQTAAQAAVNNLAVSNTTTAADIMAAVNGAITNPDPAITVAWQVNFALSPATTTSSGTITGTVRLTQGADFLDVVVSHTIAQLDPTGQTLAQAQTAAQATVNNLTVSNATTADDIMAAVNGAITNPDPAITVAWQVNFALSPATTTSSGTITGTVRLTQGADFLDVTVDRSIAQLPLNTRTVTFNTPSGVTITTTPTNLTAVEVGTNATFTVTPNTGRQWQGTNAVTVSAPTGITPIRSGNSYTFTVPVTTGVSALGVTIAANTAQIPPPTNGTDGNGGGQPTPTPAPTPTPSPTPAPTPTPTPEPTPTPPPTPEENREEVERQLENEDDVIILTPGDGNSEIYLDRETVDLIRDSERDLIIESDNVQVYISSDVIEEISEAMREDDVLTISVNTGENGAVSADVTFTVGDEPLGVFDNAIIINIDLTYFNLLGTETEPGTRWWDGLTTYQIHRITAIQNGRAIGGHFNPITGIFTITTHTTGNFTIAYVPTLNRLVLSLDSPIIYDLARNTPTQIMDVLPVIQDNRTLIPICFIAYALGADVDWTPHTDYSPSLAHITLNGQTLSFPVNGIITPELAALGMDVPPQVMSDRTMMPLRFVSEFFGAVVTWDSETRGIEIVFNPTPLNAPIPNPTTYATDPIIMAMREDEEETTAPTGE